MRTLVLIVCVMFTSYGEYGLACAQSLPVPYGSEIRVTDVNGRPVRGVVVSTLSDNRESRPTNSAGVTRVNLFGRRMCLKVAGVPQDFVLISPWDGCFFEDYRGVPTLVIARRGDKSILRRGSILKNIISRINSALISEADTTKPSDEHRKAVLGEYANRFGLKPDELDAAIRRRGIMTTDPYEKGIIALYEGNYPKAMEGLSVEVEKSRQKLLDATVLLGQSLYEQGEYQLSIRSFRDALLISPNEAAILNNLGLALIKVGEFEEAETTLKKALEIRERILEGRGSDVAEVLNNLGDVYFQQGRLDEAEVVLNRSLIIAETASDTNTVATSLNSLATVYSERGDLVKAEVLYRRALEIWERPSGNNQTNSAFVLNNLGNIYQAKDDFTEAENFYRRALASLEHSLGRAHPEVARSLDNLGNLYYVRGKYAEAEPLLERALAIRVNTYGANDITVASSLNNLAVLKLARGEYAEAEPLFVRSLKIRERALKSDDPNTAYPLSNLGDIYYTKGDYERAGLLYQQALSILEKKYGRDNPAVAAPVKRLAKLHASMGNHEKAEAFYKRALEIEEKYFGSDYLGIATTLEGYASLLMNMNRVDEASKLRTRAKLIRNRNREGGHIKDIQGADVAATVCAGNTSNALIEQAWNELGDKSFDKALMCTGAIIDRWTDEADEQQAVRLQTGQCKQPPSPAEKESFFRSSWAVSDVATAWFIRGQVFNQQKKWMAAREAYKVVLNKYSCAYTWDTHGWFWRTAEAAESELKKLPK